MVGSFVKCRETNVANVGFDEKSNVHGVAGNFAASDGESDRIGIAFTGDDNLDDGAFLPLQHVGDFAGGEAVSGFVVDFDDDVARTEAGVIGWSADVRCHDNGVILARRDDHADAIIAAALVFTEERELARVKEIGVRVEHAEHAGDGTLVDLFINVDRIGVVGLHYVQNASELLDGGLVIVGGGGGSAGGRTIDSPQ